MANEAITPSLTSVGNQAKHGPDSGCDAKRSLENPSPGTKHPNGQASSSCREARQSPNQEIRPADWIDEPLSAVMKYIVQKHHTYCRQAVTAIERLLAEVLKNRGEEHHELKQIKSLFSKLSGELLMHLVKEEATLFPYIARMEEAVSRNELFPRPSYGTVANPVRMMMMEHDASSEDFKQIRQASNNYEIPTDASSSYTAFLQALEELEQDLRVHSDLEDKVLFPRAVALERVAESIARDAKTSRL